ncbi:hypothetical protein [Roseivirga sp. E12]|uniref:hypothetical protein n=1 Tax=Roseivirga sp. E12 TaxID=2819237 RepID=UPI001ABBF0AF|nr:hypothetical protein [Roseivirga sp. E12]MBO3697359.1 hypothetical protein [Roseivirga sp. E12]
MKFEASTFVEDGILELEIDDKLVLQNNGKVSLEISKGSHNVSWRIKGKIGTSFTVSISSPAFASFQLTKLLIEENESGCHKF